MNDTAFVFEDKGQILVVDDDELVLAALEAILSSEGYNLITANSGEEAIKILEKQVPSMIICDQRMPGIPGVEVLRRANDLCPDAVRILLTGNTDVQSAVDAINLGKVNLYITKPWDNANLIETVKTSLEKYRLKKENMLLQQLIQVQHKELQKNHENLRRAIVLGGRIHEKLLMGRVPESIPGFSIDALAIPSQEIDGDFFEFYRPASHILDVVVGDVMGKGIAAALVGTAVKSHMSRFAMPYPFAEIFEKNRGWHNNILDPNEILRYVDRELSEKLIHLEFFVSLFYGRFDFRFKKFSFVDCGSTKPIHYDNKNNKVNLLQGNNYPLGIKQGEAYQLNETPFSTGDFFVFYSDGVSEARNPGQEFFGDDRIKELIEKNHQLKSNELLSLIKTTVMNFSTKDHFDDDMTLIIIKIGEYPTSHFSQIISTEVISDYSQLQTIRDFIKRLCQRTPGDYERLTHETQLVIDEAFCNIVKHGYHENPKGIIHLKSEISDDGLVIDLYDQGDSFDSTIVNEPSFVGNKDSGYGWHIIKELSDKIIYAPKDLKEGWNKLTIYKRYHQGEKQMPLTHSIENKVLVITPEGESLDASKAAEFKENILKLIMDNQNIQVVLDLNQVKFIDSSGLGSFLSILRDLNARGGDLKLSRMNSPIQRMFELVKMQKIFEIYKSNDEAVKSFK